MRPIFMIIMLAVLTACSAPSSVPTATLSPIPTFTAIPSLTETPVSTATAMVPVVDPILGTEAGQVATALFDVMAIDPSTYTLKDVNGVIVGVDNEMGKEVFRDGKFDLRYAVENAKDLKPTEYEPKLESYVGIPNRPPDEMTMEYFVPFFKQMRAEFVKRIGSDPFDDKKSGYSELMLDSNLLAWGMVMKVDKSNANAAEYLVYEESDGDINIIPIKHVSRTEILEFWVNK